jgi:choline dehydrogenase-like flavoprotein
MDADYVIVGAGAAGCVLAARLSADPRVSVTLLEAGGPGRDPLLSVPKGFYRTMQQPAHADHYATGDAATGGAGGWWLRGRGLGGSTSINGMMYVRGFRPDYESLAATMGDPGWGWAAMLAAFRALEHHELGLSPLRGVSGPLHVSVPTRDDPVVRGLLASAVDTGMTAVDDVNASDEERIGPVPSTIRRGVRVSGATAFLRPARRRPNLTVIDRARASHVVVENGRAVAVAAVRAGRPIEIRARRELILAAGSLESPGLLERSGIGAPQVLARAGIVPLVESPNVGERLLEHRGLTVHARLRPGLGLNDRLRSTRRQLLAGARYLVTRRGPIATGPYDLVGQLRSEPTSPRPDVQILLTAMSTDLAAPDLRLAPYPGLMAQGYALRPTTPSSVHVRSGDPAVAPHIDAHCLETDHDRAVTGAILARLRALLAAGPLAGMVVGEEAPGPDVATPDEAVAYARATGAGIYHAVGSCAAGTGDEDVVDARLRVRGVEGLRVVNASVFPTMPAGNTAAPTTALAWRAADLILEEGS